MSSVVTVPADSAATNASIGSRLPVLVGVDESPASTLAVAWAVSEARARSVPLRVLHAYSWAMAEPWISVGELPAELPADIDVERDARALAEGVVDALRRDAADLELRAEIVEGYPPDVIAEQSGEAALIVVGTHRLGPLARGLVGSVSNAAAARASCPVVVVCGPAAASPHPGAVVVGVKPDETAQPALAFAFDHASRHGRALTALLCWHPQGLADARPLPARAARWLAEALAGWREQYPEVEVTERVLCDDAGSALVAAATGQELLVVGRHSGRSLLGAVLGSVSRDVVHHANCPVAVVPVSRHAAH